MEPYFIAKWLHILSSTVLFGTGVGTAFQMVWAMRGNDPAIIHYVSGGVVRADWLFTLPSGIVQPLTGLWLIHLQGHALDAPWLLASYALYALAFCCWAPVAALQIRIHRLTRAGAVDMARARRYYRIWFALGWPAFGALVLVFWLMISKPDFGFY